MAQPFDFLGIAISEIGNVSERRVERLVNSQLSKLPSFLVKYPRPQFRLYDYPVRLCLSCF